MAEFTPDEREAWSEVAALFRDQDVTVGRQGTDVFIACDTYGPAGLLHDWLESLATHYGKLDATPELYEAAGMAIQWDDHGGDAPEMLHDAIKALRAAVAKADGEG